MTKSPKSQRRTILKAVGGLAGAGVLGRIAMAQDTQTTETTDTTNGGTETTDGGTETTNGDERVVILGGRTDAWLGLAPGVIERADNPTIGLAPGERYRVVWINLDGARHQLQILGEENGEEDVVLRETEETSRRGATRSISFRATDRMRRYRCRYHPDDMRGNIVRSDDFGTGTEGTFTTEDETTETTNGDFTDTTDTTNGGFTTDTTDTTNGGFTTDTTDTFTTDTTDTTDTTNY